MTQVYFYQERENSQLEGQSHIFLPPQELKTAIVPSCPGLPVPSPMFQLCNWDGHVKPD